MPTKGGRKSVPKNKSSKKVLAEPIVVKRSSSSVKTTNQPSLAITKKPTKSMISRPLSKSTVQLSTLHRDFISDEKNNFRYSLGHVVASSFSGFVAGIVASSLIWILIVNVLFLD